MLQHRIFRYACYSMGFTSIALAFGTYKQQNYSSNQHLKNMTPEQVKQHNKEMSDYASEKTGHGIHYSSGQAIPQEVIERDIQTQHRGDVIY
jgi:hypothetical protein